MESTFFLCAYQSWLPCWALSLVTSTLSLGSWWQIMVERLFLASGWRTISPQSTSGPCRMGLKMPGNPPSWTVLVTACPDVVWCLGRAFCLCEEILSRSFQVPEPDFLLDCKLWWLVWGKRPSDQSCENFKGDPWLHYQRIAGSIYS